MANKRIALTLNISLETVKWNLKNIYSKLGVSSRYDEVSWARKNGLIESGLSSSGALLKRAQDCLFKRPTDYFLKATRPCAVAYGYARIRRLVRLGAAR
ncbi:response regulator transcription factor|uniref:helix-turn-helix transcriptional regulator n=1 Tax=Pseudomonas sp. SbOxS1 TaxID=2723884 RepID=UPI0015D1452D|nr:response regulator transcription factor [Pseudomonas sp. SbOxS1]